MSNNTITKGIYLGLKPLFCKWSKQMDSFQLYLINHTKEPFDYWINAETKDNTFFAFEGILQSEYALDLEVLALTEFNKKVEVTVEINNNERYLVSLKANKMRNNLTPLPQMDAEGFLFPFKLFSDPKQSIIEPQKGIDSSDVKNIMKAWKEQTVVGNAKKQRQVLNEDLVYDLHMEALDPHGKHKDPTMFLSYQLQCMEEYLDQAISQGYEQITFIHGIGNGVLKQAIFEKCKQHPHVLKYENRHDMRFGYGATEIIIK